MTGLVQDAAPAIAPDVEREVLLELDDLVVDYLEPDRVLRAVDHVNLTIRAGEIVGLAGESGCGKTTTANAILNILQPPAEVTGGQIRFRGMDVLGLSVKERRRYRWHNVSMVFQSAMSALNPVMRVGDQFVDMMKAHERVSKKAALERAGDLLSLVGIDRGRVRAYPHELSGGMRQRVIIAMALALEPELVIMDEPTTALDVVVQREILQEVQQLQRELGFAVLFITHDLSLLLESFPPLTGPVERLTGIPGSPPDLGDPPSGCRFHPRCPHCQVGDAVLYARQTTERPVLKPVAPGHLVACHLVEESRT